MRVTMGTKVCFFVLFLEVGSRKSEVGRRTLDVGIRSRKSEDPSWLS